MIKKNGLILSKVLLGISIVVLCFSAYKIYSITNEYGKAEKEYDSLREYVTENPAVPTDNTDTSTGEVSEGVKTTGLPPVIDFEGLSKINQDVAGWIKIDDTAINYPILQGKDNQYYLNKTMEGIKNGSGSIFMDYRVNKDFSSLNTIIYGHNMKNKSMFATLLNYKDKSYFDTHKYVWIITPKDSYKYEVFSAYKCTVKEGVYQIGFEGEEYSNYLKSSTSRSYYDTGAIASENDKIITLSTCTNNDKDERYVIQAKLVE